MKLEYGQLSNNLKSIADELVSEIETVAPAAIQTVSRDTEKGILNTVSINYENIRSELGSPSAENDAELSEFFAGFEINSMPAFGWSEVNIK